MSTNPPATVVTLGEAMLRLTAPPGTRLSTAATLDVHVAGSEANVAAALAQIGVSARWISRLPDTPPGRRIAGELAALGVLVDAVQWVPEGDPHCRLGVFFAELGSTPRPTAVWYDRAGSAFAAMGEVPVGAVDGASLVHVTGITPALGPGPAALTRDLVVAAVAAGAIVSVDVNFRARLWDPPAARAALVPLLAETHVVFCAERDGRTVFGLDGDAEDVLRGVAELAPSAGLVILTRGADGCLALDDSGRRYAQAARVTAVIDRFGMGDAFVAGVLWGVLRRDPVLGLRAGVELAALKASLRGDLLRLEPGELERLLAHPELTSEVVR